MSELNIEAMRGKRVGLVLAGGGFKGAYQIGAWKALQEMGFDRFTAIAGTSVGALNAVLVANGKLGPAEIIWKEKRFLRWSPRSIYKYVFAYALLLGPFAISLIGL